MFSFKIVLFDKRMNKTERKCPKIEYTQMIDITSQINQRIIL